MLSLSATLLTVGLVRGAPEQIDTRAHHIGVRVVDGVGELYDTRSDERFVVRGANYVFGDAAGRPPELFREGAYDGRRVRADFQALAERGYNVVRVFLDHCVVQDAGCIGRVDGDGLNDAWLANVADLVSAAAETGLYVQLTSNDLPDHGGYSEQANAASGPRFAGYRNSFYLTPAAVEATRRYWRDIITGLAAHDAQLAHVLAWQLLNEQWMFAQQPPLSLRSGTVTTTTGTYDMSNAEQRRLMVADGIAHYVAEVKEEILELDPGALVTMGFFMPQAAPGWYTDPISALEHAALDYFDFHAYPGSVTMEEVAAAFGVADHPERPVVLGEYGAFRSAYPDIESAALALAGWQAKSCRLGFDGWIYWTYLPGDPSVDDTTWGLTDEDGALLDLLSPARQPDPCVPIEVPRANKAIGARASTSAALLGSGPGRAIDDDLDSVWSAGSHPPQWLRVDLGAPTTISEVQLLVSQEPAGRTTHVIEVRRASGPPGFRRIGRLDGRTREGDWLVIRLKQPLRDVTSLRVRTTQGPSWVAWRELRIFETRRSAPGA